MLRFLLLAPLATLLLGGCSLFGGDSYDDLALGTCVFRAPIRLFEADAAFHANTDVPSEARLACTATNAPGTPRLVFLAMTADELLNPSVGDQFRPGQSTTYGDGNERSYRYRSGEIEILEVSGSRVRGRFQFRMEFAPFIGPRSSNETITVKGGFYVDTTA